MRWGGWRVIGIFAVAIALAALPAVAQQSSPEYTGANANIERWARGVYLYRNFAERRERGREFFELLVYRDGTRQMITWHDLYARNAQFNSVMRVDGRLRFQEGFFSYWTGGRFAATAMFAARDGALEVIAPGAGGIERETLKTPAAYSVSLGPVSTDWWHYWYYDGAKGGSQISRYYAIEVRDDPARPVTARLIETEQTNAGAERITVPAGTFDTVTYVSGQSKHWLSGPDSMLIRMLIRDNEYVLESLEVGP
jgi:hypothetical protein